ncbi:MAG TPA: TIM-barrel domain-containing protein, partial [Trueperaceae bacterium]|nr:TIM-barrel domain-containing protein [Trueperaceae bacterium]
MILHEPYGNEDPYKHGACERYPRDPEPGDPVQVRFRDQVGATRAWVAVTTSTGTTEVAAVPLGDDLWTADIGAFPPGLVEYRFGVEGGDAGQAPGDAPSYRFEVGRRLYVTGVAQVVPLSDRVRLKLDTGAAGGTAPTAHGAYLDLSFPLAGVLRTELHLGSLHEAQGEEPAAGTRTYSHALDASLLTVTAPGMAVRLDLASLALQVSLPGSSEPAFTGSLACQWLELAGGRASQVSTRFSTTADEWLYGLGERFTRANRNGDLWDVRVYEQYKEQGKRTYLPVPFVVSNKGYGLWIDAEEPSYFDLREPQAVVRVDKYVEELAGAGDQAAPSGPALLATCIIVAPEPYQVTAAFTQLTGAIAVPPKWAFGPWMSSNSWNDQALSEAAVRRTVAEGVPASVIVIEAWSDESTFYIFNDAQYQPQPGGAAPRLADFTFAGRWPDPKAFIDYCHQHGTRVVLWQIPVLKHLDEPHAQGNADERHMLERGYAIRQADGSPYRNKGWWFTDALVIDFTNPEASAWWFDKRRYLLEELGIDGMKTDGGEHIWGRDLRAHDGRRGLQLYNAYPNLYVGAYHEFVQQATGGDGVTFSRAGYTGAQRYPGHWAGDEDSTWNAYQASVRAALSAGVCGVSMWSWDIGGFSGEVPPVELYLRSTAMAVFSPLMQYHSEGHGASEVRDRTPWNIAERHGDPRALDVYRRFAQLRMRLLDLIYDDALALSAAGLPLLRYPALAYPTAHDFLSGDPYAYLFGRDLLVAPVIDRGVEAREVRLPPGSWVDAWSGSRFEGLRTLQASAGIDRIPVFVRADSPRVNLWLA